MEEENNVIYSYVQAGDQNDGVVMSTGKAKSSLQNCAIKGPSVGREKN